MENEERIEGDIVPEETEEIEESGETEEIEESGETEEIEEFGDEVVD